MSDTDAGTIEDEGGVVDVPPPTDRPETGELRWWTAADFAAQTSDEPDWIVEQLVARGAVTELSAKVKVGKTRLVLDMVAAVLKGGQFLDCATCMSPVVYLTEERAATFRAALKRSGAMESDDLHFLLRQDARDLEWPAIVSNSAEKCLQVGAPLLVVDTLPDWADLKGDAENNAGAALEAVRPLHEAAAEYGLGVVLLRHDRKAGGALGDSGRGSSAFSGAVDVMLSLRFAKTNGHSSRRILEGRGRFDNVPERMVLDLKNEHYVCLGTEANVERNAARDQILALLANAAHPLTIAAIRAAIEGNASDATFKRALDSLVDEGLVRRSKGYGQRRTAHGYELVDNPCGQ